VSDNILESYLIRVSALPDASSFLTLGRILKNTESEVLGLTGTAINSIVKFEAATIASFTAIGLGMISLADKTAMTDQSYRLMGLRMMMTKDSARAMQNALDELGATIDEVAYDPELNKRFQYLYEQNMQLGKALGGSYDKNMRSIRDLRMEYKMLGTEVEFLANAVVDKFFDKVGLGSGDLMGKLDNLNQRFKSNLPAISDEVASDFIPVWKSAVLVLKSFGEVIKEGYGEFQKFSGLLFDDDSIKTTDASVGSVTETFRDWLEVITRVSLGIENMAKIGIHAGAAIFDAFGAIADVLRGNFSGAHQFHLDADKEGEFLRKDLESLVNGTSDFTGGKAFRTALGQQNGPVDYAGLIGGASTKYGIDPEMLAAVMRVESGGNPGIISPKGAEGLMQVMPGTAAAYGGGNLFNPAHNIDIGSHILADLLRKYGPDWPKVLAAYNAGPGNVDKYGGVPPFAETQKYVGRVLGEYKSLHERSQQSGGQVIIDTVNINVPHALPQDQWTDFVNQAMKDTVRKNEVNKMAQTAGGPFN
jgi:hypothetical protein